MLFSSIKLKPRIHGWWGRDNDLPKLSEWHDKNEVSFLLLHGMGHHPLGKETKVPELSGLADYQELHDAISFWNDRKKWKEEVETAAGVENDYKAIRNAIVRNALNEENTRFIRTYCCEAGYKLPPQIEDPEKVSAELLIPVMDKHFAVGYHCKLTATPKDQRKKNIHFYVGCWNLKGPLVKDIVYGTWDHFIDSENTRLDGIVSDYLPMFDKHRNLVNRKVKADVVNWGLTDASMYVSPYGYKFELAVLGMLNAVCGEIKSGGEPRDKLVIVSESLGSTVAVNSLVHVLEASDSESIVVRTKEYLPDQNHFDKLRELIEAEDTSLAVFLFANQYGLLEGAGAASERARKESDSLAKTIAQIATDAGNLIESQDADNPSMGDLQAKLNELIVEIKNKQNQGNQSIDRRITYIDSTGEKQNYVSGLHIVGFYDPDDALGFPFPGIKTQPLDTNNTICKTNNVLVRNPALGIYPIFRWPQDAHTKFSTNKQVINVLLSGESGNKLTNH